MAQGARRPLRQQRQSRQLSTKDATAHTLRSTTVSKNEDLIEVEKIVSILTSVSPEELRAVRGSSQDHAQYLRAYLRPITQAVDIDTELYALIAIIVNQFVKSWYAKITPDREINDKLVDVIVVCISSIQQRFVTLDILALALDDISALIIDHLHALHFANRPHFLPAGQDEIRKVYHAIRPHPALSPVPISPDDVSLQRQNQSDWCQVVVEKVIPFVLPQEDMQNPGLSVLVREIFAEMILLNGVCEKVCESWFLWETITRLLTLTAKPHLAARPVFSDSDKRRMLSIEFLLMLINTAWHVLLSAGSILLMLLRRNSGATSKWSASFENPVRSTHDSKDSYNHGSKQQRSNLSRRPILETKIWSCVACLTRFTQRMPWLHGGLSLAQFLLLHGPGKVGGQGSTLDSWLEHQIYRYLRPSVMPGVLRTARTSLFPGGALAPGRPQPSLSEVAAIRRACAEAVLEAMPLSARRIYFATQDEEAMRKDVLNMVDLLADPYINKALVISIIELVVSQLFPELR